jgi:hypothetical protein
MGCYFFPARDDKVLLQRTALIQAKLEFMTSSKIKAPYEAMAMKTASV